MLTATQSKDLKSADRNEKLYTVHVAPLGRAASFFVCAGRVDSRLRKRNSAYRAAIIIRRRIYTRM